MKFSQVVMVLISILLLIGVYLGIQAAVVLAYIAVSLSVVFFIAALIAVNYFDTKQTIELKNEMTGGMFLLSLVMSVAWIYCLAHLGEVSLLYFYLFKEVLGYTYIIRLFTKQEEN